MYLLCKAEKTEPYSGKATFRFLDELFLKRSSDMCARGCKMPVDAAGPKEAGIRRIKGAVDNTK